MDAAVAGVWKVRDADQAEGVVIGSVAGLPGELVEFAERKYVSWGWPGRFVPGEYRLRWVPGDPRAV